MTVSEQKKQLRAQVRAVERSLSREERAQSDRLIVTHVLSLPEYQAARSLFCFVGTSREIDTTAILQDALRRGTILCVPLCTSPGKMELRRIQDLEQLRPGAYGILEPVPNTTRLDLSCVELSIIPCISCDHLGHRLGQGGGYYDRLFPPGRTGAFCCAGKPWSGSQSPVRLTMWCFPWSSPRPVQQRLFLRLCRSWKAS